MTVTFDHLFGGWRSAPAYRWTNKNGAPGGIVAVDARLHPDLIVPADAVVCPGASIGDGASIGYGASIGDGASIGAKDWWLSLGPCGEYKRIVTAVHSAEHGLRWWVGCQHGIDTARFQRRIGETHTEGSESFAMYCHVIACVLTHPGYLAAAAKAGKP